MVGQGLLNFCSNLFAGVGSRVDVNPELSNATPVTYSLTDIPSAEKAAGAPGDDDLVDEPEVKRPAIM